MPDLYKFLFIQISINLCLFRSPYDLVSIPNLFQPGHIAPQRIEQAAVIPLRLIVTTVDNINQGQEIPAAVPSSAAPDSGGPPADRALRNAELPGYVSVHYPLPGHCHRCLFDPGRVFYGRGRARNVPL